MSQPESKLSRDIQNALRARGAFCHKNHGGPTMMSGLPDIEGVYQGFYFAIETKMPEGKEPTEIQKLRHRQIREAGGAVAVCRTVRSAVEFVLAIPTHHRDQFGPLRGSESP